MAETSLTTEVPQIAPNTGAVPNALQAIPYDFTKDGGNAFYFNRNWEVVFTPDGGDPYSFTGLKTVFDFQRVFAGQSSQGKISLYNLNDASRAEFVKGSKITLKVGYGRTTRVLFSNAIARWVHTERKGPDFITTFEFDESGSELAGISTAQNYPAGTSALTLVKKILSDAGLTLAGVSGVTDKVYNKGLINSGKRVQDILSEILGNNALYTVVGKFIYISAGGSPIPIPPLTVSAKTGLIGSPNIDDCNGGANTLTFTHLLTPDLFPGRQVKIQSRFADALVHVQSAQYEGDTHDSKWTVKCVCLPNVAGDSITVGT